MNWKENIVINNRNDKIDNTETSQAGNVGLKQCGLGGKIVTGSIEEIKISSNFRIIDT